MDKQFPTFEQFKEWLLKQPDHDIFDFNNPRECVLAKFLKDHNFEFEYLDWYDWHDKEGRTFQMPLWAQFLSLTIKDEWQSQGSEEFFMKEVKQFIQRDKFFSL